MSNVNAADYLKALFSIIRGVLKFTGFDKKQKEELAKNIANKYLQRYYARITQTPELSNEDITQVAFEELETIVKEIIQVVHKTLNEKAKKQFDEQAKMLLNRTFISSL